ncbi:YdgH/BhsA/McbA-like domain containing protein [Providencia sp. Me31A]|uniref:YdgH/BhsA/McbA-like domain containing protein n=1 Tax=Providencia sp. Me31A TaxID=3392637 RepID=UPI003D2C813E
MNKILVLIVSSFISFSTLAASEISKDEAKNLTKVETISHTDKTVSSAIKKISNDADNKGIEFFVITETTPEGNGNSVTVIGELYKK